MKTTARRIAAAALIAAPVWGAAPRGAAILEQRCSACHSGSKPASGFDIGNAIRTLQFPRSILLTRVEKGQMPPGNPLAPAEVRAIREWMETLPAERSHWAFQPVRRPKLPAGPGGNPVDSLMPPSEIAVSKATLMRRAHFDLVGLPPSAGEVEAFAADTSARAYENLIERLLANPRYGERWGRHWLDAGGYADSDGGEAADLPRPNAWRYRDYVIRSFNSDKPYDVFLTEQLAGDEMSEYFNYDKLPAEVVERLEATGFLRMAVDGSHSGHTRELNADYLWKALFDTQQILGSAILGLSVQCARCHDHKHEPITQRDYYGLAAFFAGAGRPAADPPLVTQSRQIVEGTRAEKEHAGRVNEAQDAAIKALEDLRKARHNQFKSRHPKGEKATDDELRSAIPEFGPALESLDREIAAERKRRIELPAIRAYYEVDVKPPVTRILTRGDYTSAPGEAVEPAVPAVLDDPAQPFRLPAPGAKTTGRRLALARWLTSPGNPLTARVMVNRIWFHHFGEGLVKEPDNFGVSGGAALNQPLLDLLASEFVRSNWSIKAMHRLIMTSEAYRSRRVPRRLEAEAYRDAVLAVSGSLEDRAFGPPVEGETKKSGEIAPKSDTRRSIYLQVRRSAPQTLLSVFSAPVMEVNCVRRDTYDSASQALTLFNSEFIAAQAERFAKRVLRETGEATAGEHAFRLAFSRGPTPRESDFLATFLASNTLASLCHALLAANEFVYID
jgi:hypothetical protein